MEQPGVMAKTPDSTGYTGSEGESTARGRTAVTTMFVIGVPRTGTTLLGYLLAGGDSVLCFSEPFFAYTIFPHWLFRLFLLRMRKEAHLSSFTPSEHCDEDGLLTYLKDLAESNELSFLVIKETYRLGRRWENVGWLDRIAAGNDPVVAITRHPYDAAVSSIRFTSWMRDTVIGRMTERVFGRLVRIWLPKVPVFVDDREIVEYFAQNWASFAEWCKRNRFFVVRYEDLVRDPGPQLRALCEHCNLPFDERMLDHSHPRASFGGLGDPSVMNRPARPVNTGSIGRKGDLRPEFREIIAAQCAVAAAELDYTL